MVFKIIHYILWRPKFWINFINLILIRPVRIRYRIHRYGVYSKLYYPDLIFNKCKLIKPENCIDIPKIWSFFNVNIKDKDKSKFEINCAGSIINVDQIHTFWSKNSTDDIDIEIIHSSHRFHWLVEGVSSGISEGEMRIMFNSINSWLDNFEGVYNGVAWHPYNVSERLCNWIVLWQIADSKNQLPIFRKKLLHSIQEHALFLSKTLEYPASGVINNHIINNARALYISGFFLNNMNVSDLGRELFTLHLPNIVSEKGYLLESSFHYQLLLTRSILEVHRIASEYNDSRFYIWIGGFARSMLEACQNTIPKDLSSLDHMPRIGDVSPDTPFVWFSPISDRLNANWNALWGISTHYDTDDLTNENNGWVLINKSGWSIVAYTHPDRRQYPSGHGHNDYGSFCLYHAGYPIFIDVGRFSYDSNNGKDYGTKSESHGALLIDSQDVLFSGQGVASILSAESVKHTNFYIDDNNSPIWKVVRPNKQEWTRKIKIDSESHIIISDRINFSKTVKGIFNIHPDTIAEKVNSQSIRLLFSNYQCSITFSKVKNLYIEKSDFFPNYGKKENSKRIVWFWSNSDHTTPYQCTIQVEIIELK